MRCCLTLVFCFYFSNLELAKVIFSKWWFDSLRRPSFWKYCFREPKIAKINTKNTAVIFRAFVLLLPLLKALSFTFSGASLIFWWAITNTSKPHKQRTVSLWWEKNLPVSVQCWFLSLEALLYLLHVFEVHLTNYICVHGGRSQIPL